ncbi:hypothetical protein GCM10012278_24910 [Nonomuraea glycinis]|uniref:Uncharacterized protein n=1 Tax=Nonomuraea glycinis TaxID=2047744 RepID=A0A918E5H6_9ACTN|nr:hypothetical protein GCM10012278_24910 [Nonomuraea glycinis]
MHMSRPQRSFVHEAATRPREHDDRDQFLAGVAGREMDGPSAFRHHRGRHRSAARRGSPGVSPFEAGLIIRQILPRVQGQLGHLLLEDC